jgi:FKBP-type peptidyl-prolyl cis-trans isomerase FkpA
MRRLIFLSILFLLAASCAKKKAEKQAKIDDDLIKEYISDNGINATRTSTGLYYFIENQGTGASCNANSDVRVAYKGYLLDGTVFDESAAEGISFNLQQVIKGWTEGIPYFKEGGNGILLIPSALGYGNQNQGPIPANSVLVFEVTLHEVL